MTEADKLWLDERFDSLKVSMKTCKENCDKSVCGVQAWIKVVETDTKSNSGKINLILGGIILCGALLGLFTWEIRKQEVKELPQIHQVPQVEQSKQLPEAEMLNHINSVP